MVKRRKMVEEQNRLKENQLIAQNLKLVASQIRMIEMHCEILIPGGEQVNQQGSIRDALKSIASSFVAIAEIVERR